MRRVRKWVVGNGGVGDVDWVAVSGPKAMFPEEPAEYTTHGAWMRRRPQVNFQPSLYLDVVLTLDALVGAVD